MSYRIAWTPPATDELAIAWLAATYRNALTAEIERLEKVLSFNPLQVGESRQSPLTRIVVSRPVSLWFDVIPDDEKVLIFAVWLEE